ncbi:hypothetical protein [Methyloversatilis thermotolerans]|uniref:hypothetical protein n=1 Tax=Methyloversatilis thermotolerans TaxID=1346290 RepID=UPI0003708956|nr:hypothetical protein [Methyloversatilis thermotolerans]
MSNRCEAAICDTHVDTAIGSIWNTLGDGRPFPTVEADSSLFTVRHEYDRPSFRVSPGDLRIERAALAAALQCLIEGGHDEDRPYALLDRGRDSGMLGQAVRDHNGGTECLNHVLGILFACHFIGMNSTGHGTQVWLTHAFLHGAAG